MFDPNVHVSRGEAGGDAVRRLCRYVHNVTKQKAHVLQNQNLFNENKNSWLHYNAMPCLIHT